MKTNTTFYYRHTYKDGCRYPGSRPFSDTELDRRLFFGREEEVQHLFYYILVENIFVLFAKSGMGKSSLINAGLMEPLRQKDFIPLAIRFNNPGMSPINTIYAGVVEAINQRNENVDPRNRIDYEPGETDTLWQFFKTAAFWTSQDKPLTPVLIFDQFEEFFTMHSPENRETFIIQLADLVRGRIPKSLWDTYKSTEKSRFPYSEKAPNVRVVISIREDYLAYLEEMSHDIPNILKNRFRLLPLTSQKAKDAIIKPVSLAKDEYIQSRGFSYAPETVEEMLNFLCERRERGKVIKTDDVEPFQLQLLCQHIEEEINAKLKKNEVENGYIVKKRDLDGKQGMKRVLQGFYENRIWNMGSMWKRIKVHRLCEKGLIENERRLSLEEEHIKRKYKVTGNLLSRLVDNRLLRSESRVGSFYYELSHDTLVQPILTSRRDRKTKRKRIFMLIVTFIIIPWIIVWSKQQNINKEIDSLFYEASNLYGMEKYEQAIEKYYSILDRDSGCKAPYMQIFNLYQKLGDYNKAIEIYENANENQIEDWRLHYRAGRLYAGYSGYEPNLSKAVQCYQRALQIDYSHRGIPHIALGDIYRETGKVKNAEIQYNRALVYDKGNFNAYKGLILIYLHGDRFDKLSEVIGKAGNAGVDIENFLKDKDIGLKIRKKGKRKEFETLFQKEFRTNRQRASYYERCGDDLSFWKKYDQAAKNYLTALKLDDKRKNIYVKLARVYIRQKKPDKAVTLYRKAVMANPDHADIYRGMVWEMKKRSMVDQLLPLYRIASEVKLNEPFYYEELGDYFNDLDTYDGANKNYRKALTLDPENANLYKKLAVVCVRQKKPDEALEVYLQAINVNKSYARIYEDIAWEMKREKMEEALERLYQNAAAIPLPDVQYFEKLGNDFAELKSYERASENYKKAIQIDNNYANAYTSLGILLEGLGKYSDASENFIKALRLDPDNTDASSHLAQVKLIRGNNDEAFNLANEMFEKKSLSKGCKMAMKFIAFSSLFFKNEKADAKVELEKLKDLLSADAETTVEEEQRPGWNYDIFKRSIKESKRKKSEQNLLLDLIGILESPISEKPDRINNFNKAYDNVFKE